MYFLTPQRTPTIMVTALCLLTLLVGCSSVPGTPTPPELITLAAPIVQDAQGLAVVKATTFAARWPGGQHTWQPQPNLGAVGGTDLVALNDVNLKLDTNVELQSPRLDYPVQFVKAGTHYVWVHGQAAPQNRLNGDSLHLGLNQKVATDARRISGFGGAYRWANRTMAGSIATLQIPVPGLYTLNVWMREDGMRFDGLAVSSNPRFVPTAATLAAGPVVAAPAPVLTPPPAPSTGPVLAVTPTRAAFSTQALKESVGVAVHATYDDTAYYDTNRMLAYLKELGVSWIRDGIKESPRPFYTSFLKGVADAGIKITLIVGDPTGRDGQFGSGEQAALVNALKTTYAGRFHQLEGPNEWDVAGRANWPGELANFYAAYRSAVRAEPSLNGVRFVGGSMAHAHNFAAYIDKNQEAATLHPYPGGEMPEQGFLEGQIARARNSAGAGGTVIATEMGYNNAVNMTGGNVGVPEDIAAHYLLRELIFNFSSGISQNYMYQLFDQKPNNPQRTDIEEWFGLVAVEGNPNASLTTWTLRKKPAFYAVDRFLDYLNDSGPGTPPATLPFEAVSLPSSAVMIPISRGDGSYDIAVWLKNRLWNTSSRTLISDTAASVTFRFGSAVDVSSYRPSVSGSVTQVGTDVSNITVPVDGKVTFFRVRP